jgi:hypothetical protein
MQMLAHPRELMRPSVGLLINFYVQLLKDGLKRISQ